MGAIDVGPGATNRASTWPLGYTTISVTNPANDTGTITSVEIFPNATLSGCFVGVFYLISGTTYKCRSSINIGGVTATGSKKTIDISATPLSIVAGDFLGIYFTGGTLERDNSSGHVLYYLGESIDPNDQVLFTDFNGNEVSIYATGATASVVVPTVTTQDADDLTLTTATLNGTITNAGGENCTIRGFKWDLHTHAGDNAYAYDQHEDGSFIAEAFDEAVTGL